MRAGAHGDEIGGDVQAVSEEQRGQKNTHGRTPETPEALSGERAETVAGGEGGAITDLLNAGHERKRDQRRPQQPELELGARLRISRNARRVIVGCTRDETGPQRVKVGAPPVRPIGLRRTGAISHVTACGVRSADGHGSGSFVERQMAQRAERCSAFPARRAVCNSAKNADEQQNEQDDQNGSKTDIHGCPFSVCKNTSCSLMLCSLLSAKSSPD
jgi:hypothetical protein